MTPTQGAILAATGPAGFFVYNKIHYGSFCPFRNNKDKTYSSINKSGQCSSSSSASATSSSFCCSKKRAKNAARKNSIELKTKTDEDFNPKSNFDVKSNFDTKSDFEAKSTSSETAPPPYRRN